MTPLISPRVRPAAWADRMNRSRSSTDSPPIRILQNQPWTFPWEGRSILTGMDVQLLSFDECPNCRLAEARLNGVFAGVGNEVPTVDHQLVTTPDEAEQAGFPGSPTILIDGRDPFAKPDDAIACSCRMYAVRPAWSTHRLSSSCGPRWPMRSDS
jgi:hypothetical protein